MRSDRLDNGDPTLDHSRGVGPQANGAEVTATANTILTMPPHMGFFRIPMKPPIRRQDTVYPKVVADACQALSLPAPTNVRWYQCPIE